MSILVKDLSVEEMMEAVKNTRRVSTEYLRRLLQK